LEKEKNLEDIKSIQMTEKSCIVTLKSVWTFRPVVICIQSDFESPKIGSNWKNWCTI
jgi:hypothetical protein